MKRILCLVILMLISLPKISSAVLLSEPTLGCIKAIDGTGFHYKPPDGPCAYTNAFRGDGVAKLFSLNDTYRVDDITVNLSETVMGGDYTLPHNGLADVVIFQGSWNYGPGNYLVPDTSNVVFSRWLVANKDPSDSLYKIEDPDLILKPGDYWLAVTNDYIYDQSNQIPGSTFRGYMAPGDVYGSPVPEPATIFLLGGGLAGALWRRRKTFQT